MKLSKIAIWSSEYPGSFL